MSLQKGKKQGGERGPISSHSKPLSVSEQRDLEAFLEGVPLEEVDFASFCHVNHDLHIYLRLQLSEEECLKGGRRSLKYHFRMKTSVALGVEVQKVKSCCVVRWPPRSKWGDQVICSRLGDQGISGEKGDVIVVLYPLSDGYESPK